MRTPCKVSQGFACDQINIVPLLYVMEYFSDKNSTTSVLQCTYVEMHPKLLT